MIRILQGEAFSENKSLEQNQEDLRVQLQDGEGDWKRVTGKIKELSKEIVITETKKRIFQEGRSGHFCEIQVRKWGGGQLKK